MGNFRYASLFAGIGGFEQGLNAVGGECVFSSEIDAHAVKSYAAIYGHEPSGDIFKIDAKDIPDIDVLVGGFPCQAFSVAGKRLGFGDARGELFFEIARIADEKKPKMLLLENVKGLVSHDKGRTLEIMLRTLTEIGYHIDFEILNSKYFGVPQNRERIFIAAVRDDIAEPDVWLMEGNTVHRKAKRKFAGADWIKTFRFDWPEQTEVSVRLRDVLEPEVDEKYYLSEEKTAKLVAELEKKELKRGAVGHHPFSKQYEFKGYQNDETAPSLIATDYKAPKTVLEERDEDGTLLVDDTQGFDGSRLYRDETPTLRSERNGLKVVEEEEQGLPIREATKKGYAIAGEGDSVNLRFPDSPTRRGRVGKQIANTLEATGVNQGVVEVEPEPEQMELDPAGEDIGIEFAGRLKDDGFRQINEVLDPSGVSTALRTFQGGSLQPKIAERQEPEGTAPEMIGKVESGGHESLKKVYNPEAVSPTHIAGNGGNTVTKIAVAEPEPQIKQISDGDSITPAIDANYFKGMGPSDIEKHRQRRPHVIEDSGAEGEEIRPVLTPERMEKRQNGRRFKDDGEEANTLTAQDRHGIAVGTFPRYRIRKLTPKECWRLQGFPDEAHDAAEAAGVSDSQRYKQAGNAVTVNVIKALGEKMLPILERG